MDSKTNQQDAQIKNLLAGLVAACADDDAIICRRLARLAAEMFEECVTNPRIAPHTIFDVEAVLSATEFHPETSAARRVIVQAALAEVRALYEGPNNPEDRRTPKSTNEANFMAEVKSIKKVDSELSFVTHLETPRGRRLTYSNYFDVEPADYDQGRILGAQIARQLCDDVQKNGRLDGAHLEAMVVDALGVRACYENGGMPLGRVGKKTVANVLAGLFKQFETALAFMAKNTNYAEYFDKQIASFQVEAAAVEKFYSDREVARVAKAKATKAAKRAAASSTPSKHCRRVAKAAVAA